MRIVPWLVAGTCLAATATFAQTPPTFEDVARMIDLTDRQQAAMRRGEIVATGIGRDREDELRAAVAVVVPTPLDLIERRVLNGFTIKNDPSVVAFGRLDGGGDPWAGVGFAPDDRSNLRDLLNLNPDKDFNMAEAEADQLKAALDDVTLDDADAATRISAAYVALLKARHAAYVAGGLAGIAPYDYSDDAPDPAAGLGAQTAAATRDLGPFLPDFVAVLNGYPQETRPDVAHRLYWIESDVEGRRTFLLAHLIVRRGPGHVAFAHRRYYVGRTYEALQVVALALPVDEGTAVFWVNSTFTNKITGFFSGIARSVGEGRITESMTQYFQALEQARNRAQ